MGGYEYAIGSVVGAFIIGFIGFVYRDYKSEVDKLLIEGQPEKNVHEIDESDDESDDENDSSDIPPLEERKLPTPSNLKKKVPIKSVAPAKKAASAAPKVELDLYPFFIAAINTVNFGSADAVQDPKFVSVLEELMRRSSLEEHQEAIRTKGLIPTLLRVIQQSPISTVATKAAFVLANISLLKSNHQIFHDLKVLKVIFDKAESIPVLHSDAFQTLLNLSARDDPIIEDVEESRAIERCLKVLKANRSTQRRLHSAALNCFDNLTVHEQHRRSLLDHGAVEIINMYSSSTDARIKETAANVLRRLHEEENSDGYKLAQAQDKFEFLDELESEIKQINEDDHKDAQINHQKPVEQHVNAEEHTNNEVHKEKKAEVVSVKVENPFSALEQIASSDSVGVPQTSLEHESEQNGSNQTKSSMPTNEQIYPTHVINQKVEQSESKPQVHSQLQTNIQVPQLQSQSHSQVQAPSHVQVQAEASTHPQSQVQVPAKTQVQAQVESQLAQVQPEIQSKIQAHPQEQNPTQVQSQSQPHVESQQVHTLTQAQPETQTKTQAQPQVHSEIQNHAQLPQAERLEQVQPQLTEYNGTQRIEQNQAESVNHKVETKQDALSQEQKVIPLHKEEAKQEVRNTHSEVNQ